VSLAFLLAEPEEPGRRDVVQAALRRWQRAMAEAIAAEDLVAADDARDEILRLAGNTGDAPPFGA
jgi:hypothetical protein